MAETRRLKLPLLDSAQAQKHVTVNTALTRLDALTAQSVLSRSFIAPPVDAVDGDVHIVAAGAAGAWAGRDGMVAFADNGGWAFAAPDPGKSVWVADEHFTIMHDGVAWVAALGATAAGAGTALRTRVMDHVVTPGPVSTTAPVIPDKAIVLGVTGRVIGALTGPGLGAWRLGVAGAADRYGAGIGGALNAFVEGVTGAPVTYYGETPLVLEAESGAFDGGVVRLCVHYFALTAPRAV